MEQETISAAIDLVSHCHATRLTRGHGHGRRDGMERENLETAADLLAEFTGWRCRKTFGEELLTWLPAEFGLDDESSSSLIAGIDGQPLGCLATAHRSQGD